MIMDLIQITKGDKVTLTQDLHTLKAHHPAGGTYIVLGFQGTLVRLSRISDRVKLFTSVEFLRPALG